MGVAGFVGAAARSAEPSSSLFCGGVPLPKIAVEFYYNTVTLPGPSPVLFWDHFMCLY